MFLLFDPQKHSQKLRIVMFITIKDSKSFSVAIGCALCDRILEAADAVDRYESFEADT